MPHSSSVSQQQHAQHSVMHSASASVSAAVVAVTSLVSFVSMVLLLSFTGFNRPFKFFAVHIAETCSERAIQEITPGACTALPVVRCAAQ
jgi:hypothetical protein